MATGSLGSKTNANVTNAAGEQLHRYICDSLSGTELSAEELATYSSDRRYKVGWRIAIAFEDGTTEIIRILLKEDHPYSLPMLAFETNERFQVWPHVEKDGTLCIYPPESTFDLNDAVGVLRDLLREFITYVNHNKSGALSSHFADEFLSYWNGGATVRTSSRITSLLSVGGHSRQIFAYDLANTIVVGDDAEALIEWCNRRTNKERKEKYLRKAALIKIDAPLVPPYPEAGDQIWRHLVVHGENARAVVQSILTETTKAVDIILEAESVTGAGLVGLSLQRPIGAASVYKAPQQSFPGFRPGKVPPNLVATKFLAPGLVDERRQVVRADHAWIHGRDQDSLASRLAPMSVAVVGCGSLGSGVARLLAQAGVGHLTLYDNEWLEWENVSRHELTSTSVGKLKAEAMAAHLTEGYPHLPEVVAVPRKVAPGDHNFSASLKRFDLIVATTGSWASNHYLADMQSQDSSFPRVIYSWLEPEALASHAVLIKSGSACFLCGSDRVGKLHVPVLADSQHGVIEVPACGGTFSPYGGIALSMSQSMVAESCLVALQDDFRKSMHMVALEPARTIETRGYKVSAAWLAQHGKLPVCGGKFQIDWQPKSLCSSCEAKLSRSAK